MHEAKLLLLLQKKKLFFESILDLTETEAHLPVDDWISVLQQKKILLSCIENVDAEMHPFQNTLSSLSQEVSELLEEIRQILRQILHLDSLNHQKRKEELKLHEGIDR